uniref:Secreted protein n=1 Tax=Bursaphelenchus xylophilus TaxID=6326 RepID=A0A1I7SJU1_BURXY
MVGGTVPMILFVVLFLVNGASCVKCYVCSSDTCKKDTWIQIDCSIGCVKLEGFVYAKAGGFLVVFLLRKSSLFWPQLLTFRKLNSPNLACRLNSSWI